MTCLEQLSLNGIAPRLTRLVEGYESLARELSLRNKNLRLLKLEKSACRMWHDTGINGKSVCHAEMLDRI